MEMGAWKFGIVEMCPVKIKRVAIPNGISARDDLKSRQVMNVAKWTYVTQALCGSRELCIFPYSGGANHHEGYKSELYLITGIGVRRINSASQN